VLGGSVLMGMSRGDFDQETRGALYRGFMYGHHNKTPTPTGLKAAQYI